MSTGIVDLTSVAEKTKSLALYIGLGAPVIATFDFFGVNIDYFIVLAVLMGIDIIMGTLISFWNSTFSSSTMQMRLARKCVYIIILATVVTAQFIEIGVAMMVNYFLIGFIFSDAISIVRHCYTILYKEKLPEADVVKGIIKGLYKMLNVKANGISGK